MNARFKVRTIATLGTLLAVSSIANADTLFSRQAAQAQVDACVAAVTDGADLRDARRVRHEIESLERRSIGHRLLIDTTVYGSEGLLREYRAVCVVTSDDEPRSFEMHEVTPQS